MATIPDKVNTGALATIVAVGAISMVGISAALTAMVRSEVDSHAEQVGASSNLAPVHKAKAEWLAELNAPPKRDPTTGRTVIPIDRAMDLVVQDLRQHPEHATEPPPPDAGKREAADAGAAEPAAADGAPAGQADAGAAPPPSHEEQPPAPTPEPPSSAAPPGEQGALPGKKNKGASAAQAPAEPPAAPVAVPEPPPSSP